MTADAEFCTPTARRTTTGTLPTADAAAHPRSADPTSTGTPVKKPKKTPTDAAADAHPRSALRIMSSTTFNASATALNPQASATTGLHTLVLSKLMPSGLLKIAAAFATPIPSFAKPMNTGTPPCVHARALLRIAKVTLSGTSPPAIADAAQLTFAHAESSSTQSPAAANRSPSLALLDTSGTLTRTD